MVKISKKKLIRKFIYASSSSVYGVKNVKDVHENMSLEPLTDYSKYKAECEIILQKYKSDKHSFLVFTNTDFVPSKLCFYFFETEVKHF